MKSHDLSTKFLVVGIHKDIDARKIAESYGMSVIRPVSKRIVVATLPEGKEQLHPAIADDPLFADIERQPRMPAISSELASVFHHADDRALLTIGLDKQERDQIMELRRKNTGLNRKM